jgi:DNA (cytosine-5)-methyltransferase 1
MTAYYNEIDPAAVAVLRELVARNVIAPGDVDDRSIKDVKPDDLRGYDQCHFFAGSGLWSVAARLAGWPDTRKLWTGSCPCQGESLAGKRLGADDPRHLWPDLYRLIRACRPPVVMGEQVAAAAGTHWLDGVCADLADENYPVRAVDIPACAVDAPHQRNRLYWVAVDDGRCEHWRPGPDIAQNRQEPANANGCFSLQSDANCGGRTRRPEAPERKAEQRASSQEADGGLLADTDEPELQGQPSARQQPLAQPDARALRNGSWWADADWIISPLDGKARRAKPGIPFLVDGLPGRVDLWRVGGNAISPVLAAEVIAAFLESESYIAFAPLSPAE